MEDTKKIEILQNLLKISVLESKIILKLLKKNGLRVSELAYELNVDRTYVQKAIRNLIRKRLIDRYQKNLKKGRCYVYFISKRRLKRRLKRELKRTIKLLDEFISTTLD